MIVSVVIPVYKAEKFVAEAVRSALNQPQTGEVLLVEDCSPDNSLAICRELEKGNSKVRVIQHPGNVNRGAGATRNLGIRSARYEYIAFLDADDFYLPGRFTVPERLFRERPEIDGVYEAIGVCFDDADEEKKWRSKGGGDLTTLMERMDPENLFEALMSKKMGHFHLDGLLVKKRIFELCGYFFENLRLHQDTAMTIQMAESGLLAPGRLDAPVAMRRVHSGNRFLIRSDRTVTGLQMRRTLLWWGFRKGSPKQRIAQLSHRYLYISMKVLLHPMRSPIEWVKNLGFLVVFFGRHPAIAGRTVFEFRKRREVLRNTNLIENCPCQD